ncbi:MAG TPA: UDP-N-acetylmuramoyl-L-alanyl-D-glutamate--2,6-diaminopimelate ligase [bacterium]|nr:UDP-N-acetylmuramoyl-L-alanyl-D-glutamate--2,6-diaminopimelate ligase [bacterium]
MLQELMKTIRVKRVIGPLKGAKVRGVTQDSRKVEKGFLFVAIPGEKLDGHDFVADAVKQGAIAAVVRRNADPQGSVPQFVVADPRAALADLAARFYGEPSLKLRVAGVTGTNGKTSVTYLLESILNVAGRKPAVLGTVNYRYGGQVLPAPHTTPESVDLQALFARMVEEGVTDVVMEVSSHALAMERVRGVHFDVAAFTNLTQDHLDYHAGLDEYFEAKKTLFTRFLAASLKTSRSAVVNLDDPRGAKITRGLPKSVERATVSVEGPADVFCRSHRLSEEGIEAEVVCGGSALQVRSPLIGSYNLQNVLVAIGAARGLGVDDAAIVKGIAALGCVPGRLERIPNGRGLNVFVDYAHTPDAVGRVAATLKGLAEKKGKRLITVFGCGGDRDRSKRPLMGREAGRFSDFVIVTSDNPRTEEPEAIIDEILPGLKDVRFPADRILRIVDREKALREAVRIAKAGDFVLVAGKGHEDYQIIGTKKFRFSDHEILRGILKS